MTEREVREAIDRILDDGPGVRQLLHFIGEACRLRQEGSGKRLFWQRAMQEVWRARIRIPEE